MKLARVEMAAGVAVVKRLNVGNVRSLLLQTLKKFNFFFFTKKPHLSVCPEGANFLWSHKALNSCTSSMDLHR